jgi:hypothetical protein
MQCFLFKGIQYKVCFREYVYIKSMLILSDRLEENTLDYILFIIRELTGKLY